MGLEKDCKLNLHSKFERGPRNLITDVAGVKVGHVTLQSEDHNVNTGVTAILPHSGNCFREKLFAGAAIINGFGKTTGLVQMDELGTLESPIVMTNTLSVGTALTASVKYMLAKNPEIVYWDVTPEERRWWKAREVLYLKTMYEIIRDLAVLAFDIDVPFLLDGYT